MIAPLISRSRVIVLEQLDHAAIAKIIERAIKLEKLEKKITEDAIETLTRLADGDARTALGALEVAAGLIKNRQKITSDTVEQAAGRKLPRYDKKGDGHYDTISAFIKSMRAGDDQAALFLLLRMVAAGEDPLLLAGW